jgi:hypothetical protein
MRYKGSEGLMSGLFSAAYGQGVRVGLQLKWSCSGSVQLVVQHYLR